MGSRELEVYVLLNVLDFDLYWLILVMWNDFEVFVVVVLFSRVFVLVIVGIIVVICVVLMLIVYVMVWLIWWFEVGI